MEIKDEHVEFAIVQRFRDMLLEPNSSYEVSHTYALFTAILCWASQRMRTDPKKDGSPEGRAARSVWSQLELEPIALAPWNIPIAGPGEDPINHPVASPDFRGHTADRLIKNLRDAAAHGDARNVKPYHTGAPGKPRRVLIGFRFKCEERNRQREVTWTGEITLLAADLVRIADEVAHRFCVAMEVGSQYGRLREDAGAGVAEAA